MAIWIWSWPAPTCLTTARISSRIPAATRRCRCSSRRCELRRAGQPPKPAWNWWEPAPRELATQWRTTPYVIDWNKDELNDLVMLDHEGYLSFFERTRRGGQLTLLPGQRIFETLGSSAFNSRHDPQIKESGLMRLNTGEAGASGRRKLCIVDWDSDGRLDLLVNSSTNINFLRNVTDGSGKYVFQDAGPLDTRRIAAHATSPTVVDWDRNGKPDLVVGAEDGFLYYKKQ
jgi:hypothetical protein